MRLVKLSFAQSKVSPMRNSIFTKIKTWVICAVGSPEDTRLDPYTLSTGARIRTKLGIGVITGGVIHVKYDKPIKNQPETDRSWSHNIDNLELKVIKE